MLKCGSLESQGFFGGENGCTLNKMNNKRKHLTGLEVEKLMAATKGNRNETCYRCLILLMFRHGLRASKA